jgi:hypothetical protein
MLSYLTYSPVICVFYLCPYIPHRPIDTDLFERLRADNTDMDFDALVDSHTQSLTDGASHDSASVASVSDASMAVQHFDSSSYAEEEVGGGVMGLMDDGDDSMGMDAFTEEDDPIDRYLWVS